MSGATPRVTRRPPAMALILAGCLAVSLLSLLGPSTPTYDPWAWIIWGRDIIHWDLVTETGPSWKPLPVFFTTPFALLGDTAAPLAWLVVARAGGLFGVVMVFRLARRLGGLAGGVVAVVAYLLLDRFVSLTLRGNSEGLLVGLVLWGVERHLERHRQQAFVLFVLGGLIRPETWPLIAAYGLWLLAAEWRAARALPVRCAALVVGGGLALPLLWFVPEYLGSGDFLRAANRALEPVADSPAQQHDPFLAVFTNASYAITPALYVGAIAAVVLGALAWRARRDHDGAVVLALAAGATVQMIVVAFGAVVGFTGNFRYVMLPAAVVCVLGGVGFAWLARELGRRVPAALVAVACLAGLAVAAPSLWHSTDSLRDQLRAMRSQSALDDQLGDVIARAGGRAALLRCGTVYTSAFETQIMAWELHVHQRDVPIRPQPPGSILAPRGQRVLGDDRFGAPQDLGRWVLRTTCADVGPAAS